MRRLKAERWFYNATGNVMISRQAKNILAYKSSVVLQYTRFNVDEDGLCNFYIKDSLH